MTAFASAFLPRLRWATCALLAAGLAACGTPRAPRVILAERCLSVSDKAPIALQIAAPGGGTLRIIVRQRGISLSSVLAAGGSSTAAGSPVDRYGAMTLLANSRQPATDTLRIVSQDSADIRGEACVVADLVSDSDGATLAAERAFAHGGRAIQARQWQRAFDDYLAAAREFDHTDRQRAAEARHAMAQLAYRQLDRNRDSYVLAARALADLGPGADPGLRSALVELQTTSLVESIDESAQLRRARVLHLLATAKALALRARFGARELPRLVILRGFFEYAMENRSNARTLFETAAAQCKALHDWECFARAHQNFAILAEESGNNQVALQAYTDALQFLNPVVAPELTADIWDNLGRLQGSVGIFSRAEKSHLNATRLYAQLDDCDGVRRVLARLGTLLVEVGSVADAVDYLQRAASLGCPALMALSYREPSRNSQARLDPKNLTTLDATPEAADALCRRPVAVKNLTRDGKFAIFHALLALSDVATFADRPDTATRCLTLANAYDVSARTQQRLANATGRVFLELGEAAAAQRSFARAIEVASQAHMPATNEYSSRSYLGLAQAALLGRQLKAAQGYAVQSLILSSARADISQVVAALHILARVLSASGDAVAGVRILKAAANLAEQVPIDELDAETRATYLATQHGVFAELTDLLIADATSSAAAAAPAANANAAWEAFNESERGHARSLRYALSQTRADDPRLALERGATQYQDLMRRIAALAASHASAADVSTLLQRLVALAAEQPRSAGLDPALLSTQLAHSQATLIEYAAGRDDMYAFVIAGAQLTIVQLGNLKRIAAAAADLFERLRDPESAAADVKRAGETLAALALWPLTRLVKSERVIFVPDDSLNTVPFAALPWSAAPDGRLALERAEVAIAPSALFLMHHPENRLAAGAAARFELIGAPIFGFEDWRRECLGREVAASAPLVTQPRSASDWAQTLPQLPGSRRELLAIAALTRAARPGSHVNLRLGCMATPNALRAAAASAPELLHIATHGYVDALRPRLSALALSRDSAASADGGIFGLLDILGIKLSSRLVVLSACDTSRGQLLPGEGVLGPAQAFLQSGAAAVLASYWRIDDAATASFMQGFYKHLLNDRLPVAAALRRTQLDALSAGAAHTWAAFALYGWPDSSI
jgi:CHAT domain-containing protein